VSHPYIQIAANLVGLFFIIYLAKNFDREKAASRKQDTRSRQILFGSFFGLCAGTTMGAFIFGIGQGILRLLGET
jgi:hypothetical protein